MSNLNLNQIAEDLGSPLDFPTPITVVLAHGPRPRRVVGICTVVRLTDSEGQPLSLRGLSVAYPDGLDLLGKPGILGVFYDGVPIKG